MKYLLDANIFLQSKNQWYRVDVVPGFWSWIEIQHRAGAVASSTRIHGEIKDDPDLKNWVSNNRAMFLKPGADVTKSYALTQVWAHSQPFVAAALAEWADEPDAWLVAHAHSVGATVVTLEKPSDGHNRVKIPNACDALDVPYIDLWDLLRRERVRLVLDPGA